MYTNEYIEKDNMKIIKEMRNLNININKKETLPLQEKGQDLMKMNLNIAKDFHKEVKHYALENDITITELVYKSLQEYTGINTNKEEILKEVVAEKMVTLTILVPQSIREDLKVKVIQNKTTVTNLILNYLKEYISK